MLMQVKWVPARLAEAASLPSLSDSQNDRQSVIQPITN
jgi:hypothetical protein